MQKKQGISKKNRRRYASHLSNGGSDDRLFRYDYDRTGTCSVVPIGTLFGSARLFSFTISM